MLKSLLTFLLAVLLTVSVFGQDGRYILRPNGELVKLDANTEVKTAIQKAQLKDANGKTVQSKVWQANVMSRGTIDTATYFDGDPTSYTSRFGFNGQDVMLTWYQAPADLTIKAAGFKAAVDDIGYETVSIRLVKPNMTKEQLNSFSVATWLGFYPQDGDGFGNIAAFPEDATGDWSDQTEGTYPNPFGNGDFDLWSDQGFGWPVTPQGFASDEAGYTWVDMSNLGNEPTVASGEIFAVAIIHDGSGGDGTNPDGTDRTGFWSMDASTTGNWSWKYYENGRNSDTDGGWWVREYTFDFPVVVDLTGDRAPSISDVTVLGTTVDQGSRTVEAMITDDNPGGGASGVASAEIMYSVNGGAEQSVAMSGSGDMYTGDIPGMSPGDEITYYVKATDVGGLSSESVATTYQIYLPTPGVKVLVNVNGASSVSRLNQLVPYYFDLIGVVVQDYDLWYYGEVTEGLLNNYTTVVELQMSEGAPSADNRAAYTAWLAGGNKNLLIAGQEELGFLYGYENQTFEAGDFEYDVLGVLNSYNDVSYAASGDQNNPSIFYAQAETLLGDSLAMAMASMTAPTDTLFYDPVGVLGDANAANWLDQFDPRTDISGEVFMHGVSLGQIELPTGQNWTDANGNQIVFMSYDPLVLQTSGGEDAIWIATSSVAPFHQAMMWFGLNVVGVKDISNGVPSDFTLSQNYPNPFNPTTTIRYSLTKSSDVSLKVYDVLGKEVATLINQQQNAGSYEYSFDASNLASGMYIYKLQAGDFTSTRKMMLMK